MSKIESGPQMPNLESGENSVDKLTRWKRELEELKRNLESKVDELAKKLGVAIVEVQEKSLENMKQDEFLSEVLESQTIMKEVEELREEVKRLEDLIEQIDKATKK